MRRKCYALVPILVFLLSASVFGGGGSLEFLARLGNQLPSLDELERNAINQLGLAVSQIAEFETVDPTIVEKVAAAMKAHLDYLLFLQRRGAMAFEELEQVAIEVALLDLDDLILETHLRRANVIVFTPPEGCRVEIVRDGHGVEVVQIFPGQRLALQAQVSGPGELEWLPQSFKISSGVRASYRFETPGVYRVEVILMLEDKTRCSDAITVEVLGGEIEEVVL